MEDEFYHIGGNGEGESGPFATMEEAMEDGKKYLTDSRWHIDTIKIVKVVAVSDTKVTFDVNWKTNG